MKASKKRRSVMANRVVGGLIYDDEGDPSLNVIALSEAAQKRQDDLRELTKELNDQRFQAQLEMIKLRSIYNEKMMDAERRRVDEQLELRADFNDKLGEAESSRINAIRAVDVNAVGVASQRAAEQANVLAAQVATSAETLRSLVATTASAATLTLQQITAPLASRITSLEQAQYKDAGGRAYTDPAFSELLAEMKGLREARNQGDGGREYRDNQRGQLGTIVGVVGAIAFVLSVAIGGATLLRAPTVQPTVQYVPAPVAPAAVPSK